LSEGVEQLHTVGKWEEFLAAQARFHRYSYLNTLLILSQRPDAQAVAGFVAWRALNRSVRRGERAIWIVAPLRRRSRESRREGEEVIGFRRVGVFDVTQTEGDALVELCRPLEGADSGGAFHRLVAVAGSVGFEVKVATMPGGVFGDCTYATSSIRVSTAAAPAQAVKTLAHEIAHALLHKGCENRALAELEAESTAFVVCRHLGLDTSDYSLGYVTRWAGGTDIALQQIKQSCDRITTTARSIIERIIDVDEQRALSAPGAA
jgi:antirestriction protein ArdC